MIKNIKGKNYRKAELDYRELTEKALAAYNGYDDPGQMLLTGTDGLYYVWDRDSRHTPELIGDIDAMNTELENLYNECFAEED